MLYYIFNSKLYNDLIYEQNVDPSLISNNNQPVEQATNNDQDDQVLNQTNDQQGVDLQNQDNQNVDQIDNQDQVINKKFRTIQKFIIYQKLRELQYKLDDIDLIRKYKNRDELNNFTRYLNYFLIFFQYLTYEEIISISPIILNEFKKIK